MGTGVSKEESVPVLMPVRVAAAELKVTHQRVYQLLAAGLIVGKKVGRTWLISARSVKARIALLDSEGGE